MIKVAIDKLLIQLISECRYRLVGTFVEKRQKIKIEREVRYLYDLLGCVED